jgi:hypothetical protein
MASAREPLGTNQTGMQMIARYHFSHFPLDDDPPSPLAKKRTDADATLGALGMAVQEHQTSGHCLDVDRSVLLSISSYIHIHHRGSHIPRQFHQTLVYLHNHLLFFSREAFTGIS